MASLNAKQEKFLQAKRLRLILGRLVANNDTVTVIGEVREIPE